MDWRSSANWKVQRIKRLSQVKRGASPRPIDDPKYFDEENGEFSWVRIADVSASERYLERTTQKLSELGSSLSVKRYPGDFFVSIAGTVGKPIITKIKCCIHDGFVWFPNLKLNPEFLYYIFTAGELYKGLGKWGTQLNLNTETIGDIYIPKPSDVEIDEIVRYLDYKTSQIDKLIEKKQRQIELLKEQRTEIINQAVTKGLNPNVKMKDSGIEWLGEIPEHWEVKKIKFLLRRHKSAIKTGPFGSQLKSIDFRDEGIKVYNQRNVLDGNFEQGEIYISPEKYKELEAFEIFPDDILITTRGTIGKCAIFTPNGEKGVLHPCLIRMQLDQNKVINEYIVWYIQDTSFFEENVHYNSDATTIDVIYSDTLKEVQIPTPPLDEQRDILAYMKKEAKELENTVNKAEKQIQLLHEYRTALISEAVTGKINVREH